MYVERPSLFPGAFVWTSTTTSEESRILPDGCIDIIWDGAQLFVAGPDTTAHVHRGILGTRSVGLRFAPGFAPRVLNLPARELVDRQLPLDAIWPDATVRRIGEQMSDSSDPGRLLESVARSRVDAPTDPLLDHVTSLARRRLPADRIAAEVGFSTRQLQRRSNDAYGYGVKTLSRILRLGSALDLVRGGTTAADSAAHNGFADQAHFARDVKDLTGIPLRELIRGSSTAADQSS